MRYGERLRLSRLLLPVATIMDFEIGSLRITPLRLLVFASFVAAFFFWFGYWPAEVPRDEYFFHRRISLTYFCCSALFITATGVACFGEQQYGMFPPTSLRPVLIILGALLMIASAVWMDSLRTNFKRTPSEKVFMHPTTSPKQWRYSEPLRASQPVLPHPQTCPSLLFHRLRRAPQSLSLGGVRRFLAHPEANKSFTILRPPFDTSIWIAPDT